MNGRRRILGIVVAVSALVTGPAQATVRTVTDFGDSGASGQIRKLIEASAAGDVILIPAGPPIVLTGGALTIGRNLTIEGAGPGATVIDGGGASGVVLVQARVTLRRLTIRGGQASTGGGILVSPGSLTLVDAVVSGNRADLGGGLAVATGSRAVVEASTIHDNEAESDGGGIRSQGLLDLTNVTISGNRAGNSGGGLLVYQPVTLRNVTVTGNVAALSGAAWPGGGIVQNGGTIGLHNTVIAGNTALSPGVANDCFGDVVSLGSNLVQDDSFCSGLLAGSDLTGVTPLLDPLADNGGPTPTHALLPGSPAHVGYGCPAVDQRGVARPGGSCDIGAFERAPVPLTAFDFDQDGVADIVVGAGRGDEPRVRVLSGRTGAEVLSFLAYDGSVRSGVRTAVCDLTGDGVPDVVTAPGGPGPVRAFDGVTGAPLAGALGGFDPVPAGARSVGVTVGCVDVSGDGVPDLVVGVPGAPGVEARVLTFNGVDASPLGAAPAPGLHGAIFVAP